VLVFVLVLSAAVLVLVLGRCGAVEHENHRGIRRLRHRLRGGRRFCASFHGLRGAAARLASPVATVCHPFEPVNKTPSRHDRCRLGVFRFVARELRACRRERRAGLEAVGSCRFGCFRRVTGRWRSVTLDSTGYRGGIGTPVNI